MNKIIIGNDESGKTKYCKVAVTVSVMNNEEVLYVDVVKLLYDESCVKNTMQSLSDYQRIIDERLEDITIQYKPIHIIFDNFDSMADLTNYKLIDKIKTFIKTATTNNIGIDFVYTAKYLSGGVFFTTLVENIQKVILLGPMESVSENIINMVLGGKPFDDIVLSEDKCLVCDINYNDDEVCKSVSVKDKEVVFND